MFKHIPLTILIPGFFTTALLAQSVVVPNAYATKPGESAFATPFSYANYIRHQQLIDAKQVLVGQITGLAFRSRTPTTLVNVRDRAWQDLRVQLSSSPNTLSTVSTNYSANHGKDLVTVFRGKMDCYKLNTPAPLEFNVVVPFSSPFLFVRVGPLVVDLFPQNFGYEFNTGCGGGNGTGMNFTSDATMRYVFPAKSGCTTNDPPSTHTGNSVRNGGYVLKLFYNGDLMPYGRACAGTGGVFPAISNSGGGAKIGNSGFKIDLSGGPTNGKRALLVIGTSNRLDNATRLPVNLSKLGMTPATNCWQETNILFGFFSSMAAGKASFPAGIPNDTRLRGVEVFTQWAVDDPGLGSFTTTQGGLIKVQ
ncbi:MAG: hypothetical protein ACYTGO_17660 [Planctomycetota bacterium]|jgi:hypothetical protein